MNSKLLTTIGRHRAGVFLVSAMAFAVGNVLAATEPAHPDATSPEMSYQAAPGSIDPAATKDLMDGEGPKMTKAEFAEAKEIFFQRCNILILGLCLNGRKYGRWIIQRVFDQAFNFSN